MFSINSLPADDTEAEDSLYSSYICTLVLIDSESKAATPNFTRVQYLQAKADADHAELECIALRLSLMPEADVGQLNAQLLEVAESALKQIEDSATGSLDQNAHSHPKIARRNLNVNLEQTCGEAAAKVEAAGNDLLSDLRAKSERARRLSELLGDATIVEHKRKMSAELLAAGGGRASETITAER